MKAGEIVRKLKKQEWFLYEHGAEHDKWSNKNYRSYPYISVPRHKSKELSRGVESEIKAAMREVEKNRREKKDG